MKKKISKILLIFNFFNQKFQIFYNIFLLIFKIFFFVHYTHFTTFSKIYNPLAPLPTLFNDSVSLPHAVSSYSANLPKIELEGWKFGKIGFLIICFVKLIVKYDFLLSFEEINFWKKNWTFLPIFFFKIFFWNLFPNSNFWHTNIKFLTFSCFRHVPQMPWSVQLLTTGYPSKVGW